MLINNSVLLEKCVQYGTPMYVYDGDFLKSHYNCVRSQLNSAVDIFLSFKANSNASIASLFRSWGTGIEVASVGELKTALKVGYTPDNIIFSGPGKRENELAYAIEQNIYCIIVESIQELEKIATLAFEKEKKVSIGVRINPDSFKSGAKIKMGGVPRAFGIDESKIDEIFSFIATSNQLHFKGIHIYSGTQILQASSILDSFAYTINLAKEILEKFELTCEMINLGGGFGIPYFQNEKELDFKEVANGLNLLIMENKKIFPRTRYILESGRYLLAESGAYLTGITYVKESKGEKFLVTDGGLHHHQAVTFRGRVIRNNYPMSLLKKSGELKGSETVSVVGPLCTPEDLIGRNVQLPVAEKGDVLCIQKSGAYGLSYSPCHFLGHPTPMELLFLEGRELIIREKGEPEDLLLRQNIQLFE
ncbi:type III PLP-dependent enzyme [Bacillus cereus group sp. N21]|uniref:type III PLP-dependent enzyme n=1 Tax=Bacillus cereus group sp. N21 TaxID=2794591 RepID=UPI0018F73314|nr:type III PLP-dependent enzyme [Bacillus cereus group sp. N21]MBJ8030422.1 type III PLP-dependent enzyme [Bacillus cereus group sp. N21]